MSADKRTASLEAEPQDPSSAPLPFRWGMIYLIARIFYVMRMRSEEALRPMSLTPMQMTILATLGRWNGLSSAELSRRFHVTPQTMGEMILNLERRGLVERRANPANRRALKLGLTAEGQGLVKHCDQAMDEVEHQMFGALSDEELADMRERLISLHEHLGITAE